MCEDAKKEEGNVRWNIRGYNTSGTLITQQCPSGRYLTLHQMPMNCCQKHLLASQYLKSFVYSKSFTILTFGMKTA